MCPAAATTAAAVAGTGAALNATVDRVLAWQLSLSKNFSGLVFFTPIPSTAATRQGECGARWTAIVDMVFMGPPDTPELTDRLAALAAALAGVSGVNVTARTVTPFKDQWARASGYNDFDIVKSAGFPLPPSHATHHVPGKVWVYPPAHATPYVPWGKVRVYPAPMLIGCCFGAHTPAVCPVPALSMPRHSGTSLSPYSRCRGLGRRKPFSAACRRCWYNGFDILLGYLSGSQPWQSYATALALMLM